MYEDEATEQAEVPEDKYLAEELQRHLAGAQKAMEHHDIMRDRASRVAAACKAGLEQLQAKKNGAGPEAKSLESW
jgi:hypothetical protein